MDIKDLYQIYKQYPSVQTDTRKLKEGDIFIALKGPNFNGNKFAQQAIDSGAAYAIVDEAEYQTSERIVLVQNGLIALQQLAQYHRQQFSIPFIAITGSNGKTTTKELVTTVLNQSYRTVATFGNLNNHIGVPLTILSIPMNTEMAVIEMGANHLKEISSYCEIAQPTHAIITNCGKAHIEGFGSEEGVRQGKGELYNYVNEHNGIIFRNTDLPYLVKMAGHTAKQVTYGSANASYVGKPLNDEVLLKVAILNRDAETTIKTQLVGSYNYHNVMTAVAIGMHFNISIDNIKLAIESYLPDNSRSQLISVGSNKVIMDAYNANPTSMKAAISNFANTSLPNKVLWLGAMKEMGVNELEEHQELVNFIKQYKWQDVVLVGQEFEILDHPYTQYNDVQQAANAMKSSIPSNSSILIKGSRGSKMEVLHEVLNTAL